MRRLIEPFQDLTCQYPDHKVSEKYQRISDWIDRQNSLLEKVAEDLGYDPKCQRGARGLAAESVLRAALYQASEGLTFRELEFALTDSQTARAFCRLNMGVAASDSTLCHLIGLISVETWQHLQWLSVQSGLDLSYETGRKVRMDATVITCNIHDPTDSSLIADALRCVSRVAANLRKRGIGIYTRFAWKSAKKIALKILNARNAEERRELYAELIEKAKQVSYQRQQFLSAAEEVGVTITGTFGTMEELFDKLERVLDQTNRRVILGQTVSASAKLVSIFESHCDIIVKERRKTQFGHKVVLTTGVSRLILDFEVLRGNPNDADIFENTLERTASVIGRMPTQVAADGGFSSIENVDCAKEMGVKDVAFSKYPGMGILDMCKTDGVFKALRNFRAGIEGDISNLKRGFSLSRCVWKGLDGFMKQAWSRVCAYNLAVLFTS